MFCVQLKWFGYDRNTKKFAWNAHKLPTPIHINSVLDLPGGRYSLRSMACIRATHPQADTTGLASTGVSSGFFITTAPTQHFPACPPKAEGTFPGDVPNAMVTPTVACADSRCAFAAPHPMPLPVEDGTACIASAVPAMRAAVVKAPEETEAYVSAPPAAKGAADAGRESADDAAEPAPASGADRDRHQRKRDADESADESNRFLPPTFAGETLRRDALKLMD